MALAPIENHDIPPNPPKIISRPGEGGKPDPVFSPPPSGGGSAQSNQSPPAKNDTTIIYETEVSPEQSRINVHLNSEIRKSISEGFNRSNAEIEGFASFAKAHNPEIPPAIFDDIIATRKKYLPQLIDQVAQDSRVAPDGAPKSRDWLDARKLAAEREMQLKVMQEVKQNHYARNSSLNSDDDKVKLDRQVQAAFSAVQAEAPSKGIIDSAVESVYDKKKGGFQMGGVVGGVLGLLLGGMFTGTSGGIMGIITTIAVAALGVWAGNKYSEMSNNQPPAPPVVLPPKKVPAPAQGQEKAKGATTTAVDQSTLVDKSKHPNLAVDKNPEVSAQTTPASVQPVAPSRVK